MTVVFFAVDMFWLGIVAKDFYRTQMGALLRTDFLWSAAILFYLLFLVGALYFAVLPAVHSGEWTRALMLGALFGFFTYMTYDLTNLATLKDWPLTLTIVDTLWGTTLSAIVATAGFFIAGFIGLS
jgi:uncharacterized membrane protein